MIDPLSEVSRRYSRYVYGNVTFGGYVGADNNGEFMGTTGDEGDKSKDKNGKTKNNTEKKDGGLNPVVEMEGRIGIVAEEENKVIGIGFGFYINGGSLKGSISTNEDPGLEIGGGIGEEIGGFGFKFDSAENFRYDNKNIREFTDTIHLHGQFLCMKEAQL